MTYPDWLPAVLLGVYTLTMITLVLWPIIHPLDPPDNDDQ